MEDIAPEYDVVVLGTGMPQAPYPAARPNVDDANVPYQV